MRVPASSGQTEPAVAAVTARPPAGRSTWRGGAGSSQLPACCPRPLLAAGGSSTSDVPPPAAAASLGVCVDGWREGWPCFRHAGAPFPPHAPAPCPAQLSPPRAEAPAEGRSAGVGVPWTGRHRVCARPAGRKGPGRAGPGRAAARSAARPRPAPRPAPHAGSSACGGWRNLGQAGCHSARALLPLPASKTHATCDRHCFIPPGSGISLHHCRGRWAWRLEQGQPLLPLPQLQWSIVTTALGCGNRL